MTDEQFGYYLFIKYYLFTKHSFFWEKMTIKKQKLDLSLSAMPTFAILPPKIYRNNEYLKNG